MKILDFIEKAELTEKSECERAKLVCYFHYKETDSAVFSMALISDLFAQFGFNVPNRSRLKEKLTKGKDKAFINSKGKATTIEFIPAILQSIEKSYGALWADNTTIESDSEIIDEQKFSGKRQYLDQLIYQINHSYANNCYDAAAVLMRRLFEVMLVLSYQNLGIDNEIKDSAGNGYIMLDGIVKNAKNNQTLKLSRIKNEFDTFRVVGNFSAHNITYTAEGEERAMFVTGVNCNRDTAFQEMQAVKERFGKTGGNVAYHAYQSFKPGEVTPGLCHQLGVELAKRMWGDEYQVLVATHFNTGTYHNHFVVNSVGLWDGRKFNCGKRAYYQFRRLSDDLCREYQLSTIKNPKGKTPRSIYFAEKNGEPTKYKEFPVCQYTQRCKKQRGNLLPHPDRHREWVRPVPLLNVALILCWGDGLAPVTKCSASAALERSCCLQSIIFFALSQVKTWLRVFLWREGLTLTLYCADCGSKLGYSATNNYKREQAFFFCSAYRGNSNVCSAHFIREKVVAELLLEGLQRLLWYIQVYEKRFAQEQMERFGLQEKKELTARGRELDKAKQRVVEIDQLIQKSYEDMSKGLLSEERFAILSVSLEVEQKQLKAAIPEMEASLEATTDKAADLQRFIERARQVTRLTELTPEIVHEFIEKIVVSKPDKVDGKRHQRVDIHYNTIGLWCAPSPEEMEKLFQAHLAGQHKKTA